MNEKKSRKRIKNYKTVKAVPSVVKSIPRPHLPEKMFTKRRRVGFLGLLGAGKTVFITSLINHLKYSDPKVLAISPKRKKRKKNKSRPVSIIEVKGGLAPKLCENYFDYSGHREDFKKQRWPEKTRQLQEYRARYCRTDSKHTIYDVSLLDMPGERLGDVTMLKSGFDEWSTEMKDMLTCAPYNHASKEFVKRYEELENENTGKLSEEAVNCYLESYKKVMADLIVNLKNPAVSPSTFYINPEDQYFPQEVLEKPIDEQKEWLLKNRFSGLDADSQFAPLPANETFKSENEQLYETFSARYEQYKKMVAEPIHKALSRCDSLIVLIDVPGLLQNGDSRINALDNLLKHVVDGLNIGSRWPRCIDFITPGRVANRLAFVASKADKVHKDDRLALQSLLQDMCKYHAGRREVLSHGLKTAYEYCSAVKSVFQDEVGGQNDKKSRHIYFVDYFDGQKKKMTVPEIPDSLPDSILPGQYEFPETLPILPGVNRKPPKHIHLEKVANLIFD